MTPARLASGRVDVLTPSSSLRNLLTKHSRWLIPARLASGNCEALTPSSLLRGEQFRRLIPARPASRICEALTPGFFSRCPGPEESSRMAPSHRLSGRCHALTLRPSARNPREAAG